MARIFHDRRLVVSGLIAGCAAFLSHQTAFSDDLPQKRGEPPGSCNADGTVEEETAQYREAEVHETCAVRVRLLQGLGAKPAEADRTVVRPVSNDIRSFAQSPKFSVEREPTVISLGDASLEDVRTQLEGLPFTRFRILSSEQKEFPLGGQAEFGLKGEHGLSHNITVIAHERLAERVRLGLSWDGPNGESLVQTHLSVQNGEHVVVGADGPVAGDTPDHSTVICVKVKCE